MALPTFLQPEVFPYASIVIVPAEAVRVVCAWCPDFDGQHPSNAGASHGMCDACAALFDAAIEAELEEHPQDSDRDGEACTPACGHCGRCS